ncbi:MAG TPA: class I SAM-dependent methyltransferase, partial [Edaphobacter sp.]|nr:class I SAM-dependent methyltransferase [Edaphobacter sp.]
MRTTFTRNDARATVNLLEALTSSYGRRNFGVQLWDGTSWGDTKQPRFTLVLKHPGAVRKMFAAPNELALGEAFVHDDFDIEGDMEAAFELADYLLAREYSVSHRLRLGSLLLGLPDNERVTERYPAPDLKGAVHSKQRDSKAIRYHYDVSNDFYALWLDSRMVYSCGYFKLESDTLDTAQEQKLDYLCRKLRLRRGDRILDLGCGWGGLMEYAVIHYGVHACGVTLSIPQAELARKRFRQAGISDRCRVEVSDYR